MRIINTKGKDLSSKGEIQYFPFGFADGTGSGYVSYYFSESGYADGSGSIALKRFYGAGRFKDCVIP